jgi:transketolase
MDPRQLSDCLQRDESEIRCLCTAMRRWIVERSCESQVGHIGSALSIVEIMAVLWTRIMRDPATKEPDRDRFILAKGHAALCLYAVMRGMGLLDDEALQTYCKDGSILGAHPERGLAGVEVATGSLGQGLSVGCGLAYALRARNSPARVFVVVSDAECNEGQVWEAIMFAAHQRLDNLIVVVDVNGMQAMGRTADILDLSPMGPRWRAFGWHDQEVDGHDTEALFTALTSGMGERRGPAVVLARTVAGKGVSFMEDQLAWHYRNIEPQLARRALFEIGGLA